MNKKIAIPILLFLATVTFSLSVNADYYDYDLSDPRSVDFSRTERILDRESFERRESFELIEDFDTSSSRRSRFFDDPYYDRYYYDRTYRSEDRFITDSSRLSRSRIIRFSRVEKFDREFRFDIELRESRRSIDRRRSYRDYNSRNYNPNIIYDRYN